MTEEKNSRKKRERSPNYPAIDLKTAIEKASITKDELGKGFSAYPVVLKQWGYSKKSSSGLVSLAALKKFGLIEDQGAGDKREIKLSDLASKILFHEKNSNEWLEAIQKAALNPNIHKEIWEKFKDSKMNEKSIEYYLVFSRKAKFTENAAHDFIRQFLKTISFAKLLESDIISGQEEDKFQSKMEDEMTSMSDIQTKEQPSFFPKGATQTLEIPIFLPPNKYGRMQIPYPLTKDEWGQIMVMIEAYKQSLIASSPSKEMSKKEEQENKP